jgi:hypothetical protein
VSPGDTISAGVWLDHGQVFYSIADKSTGSIAKGQISYGPHPPLGQVAALVGLTPGTPYLEKFATIHLSAWVTVNGKTVPIGAVSPEKAILTDATGKITEAVPTGLSHDGTSFGIRWVGN